MTIRTHSDHDRTDELGWRLTQHNVPQVVVPPPPTREDLREVSEVFDLFNQFRLVQATESTTISDSLHARLLQESLDRHEEIWRELAER